MASSGVYFKLASVLVLWDADIIFEFSRITNPKRQFLSCAPIAFSKRLTQFQPILNSLNTNLYVRNRNKFTSFYSNQFLSYFLPPALSPPPN